MVVIPTRVRVVVVVAALALAAGLLTLALLTKPTQAKAESFTASDWSAFAFTDISPCTGEPYSLEGTVHMVAHYTQDANGGYLVTGEVNAQGSGVGDTSGATYRFQQKSAFHRRYNGFFPDNFTAAGYTKVTRQGSATPTDDFVVPFVGHFTVNANGEMTSTFNKAGEGECV
jgi:hypothetical protein